MMKMMKKIVLGLVAVITFQTSAQINSELKAHYEAYYNQMRAQGDVSRPQRRRGQQARSGP